MFYTLAFDLLRKLPVDLLQFVDSIGYFDFSVRFSSIKSFEIFSLPKEYFDIDDDILLDSFNAYSNVFSEAKVKVFIVDGSLGIHNKVFKLVSSIEHSYVTIIGLEAYKEVNYDHLNNYFIDEHDLVKLILRDVLEIGKTIEKHYSREPEEIKFNSGFPINPNRALFSLCKLPGSNVTLNNYLMLNQIIGNIWLGSIPQESEHISSSAGRIRELIQQCQIMDSFIIAMHQNDDVKPVDVFQPMLPTLVLVFPYHFPKFNQLLRGRASKYGKSWLLVSRSEQNLNYEYIVDEVAHKNLSVDERGLLMTSMAKRMSYLDSASFVHARFSFSPIIRLPHVGKSINKELSFLERPASTRLKTLKNIKLFGNKLRELTLNADIIGYLSKRDSQLFVISDMPVEWLYLGDYPLCFTHDICRIPELNKNALLNSQIHLQRYLYEIPSDLLSKTLVVHCADKDDKLMNEMFDVVDSYKSELGFQSVRCESILQIKKAIDDNQPDFLIFDCHGSSDRNDLSSYLVINEQHKVYLTGEEIVRLGISAPLIMLSACSTMPNYGYVKLLSDAFMQAGAYSVTTTFLPIRILDSAALIVRILNKLELLRKYPYHKNWLGFMSHVLRTSCIHEAVRSAKDKLRSPIENEEIAALLTKSMQFNKRNDAMKDLDNLLRSRSDSGGLNFDQLGNDWLFYSIIGRADLLIFKLWNDKNRELNVLQV
ncbi:MAG: CHAT domain-containing protein [Chitinophagaceae bacterium]